MTIFLKLPEEVMIDLALRAKQRRLILKLTQVGLARRSGISLGSIKRFERTGEISIKALLKLALVLDALEDFTKLFQPKTAALLSLDDLLAEPKIPKKGRLK